MTHIERMWVGTWENANVWCVLTQTEEILSVAKPLNHARTPGFRHVHTSLLLLLLHYCSSYYLVRLLARPTTP